MEPVVNHRLSVVGREVGKDLKKSISRGVEAKAGAEDVESNRDGVGHGLGTVVRAAVNSRRERAEILSPTSTSSQLLLETAQG
jgi:hypothetical protein